MSRKYLFYISQNYSYAILRPLQVAILARGDEVAWFLYGDEINRSYLKADEQRIANINDVVAYAPDASFVPGNMIPSFIPGLKVAVFHGFDPGKMNRRGQNDHLYVRDCFDLYCTQGPNTTNPFTEFGKQLGFFNVVQTGWPTLDPLFRTDKTAAKQADSKPTILMCSTMSRQLTCAPHLYDEVKRLSQNSQWRWLVQFHPKMPNEIVEQYKALQNDNLTFIETDDVIPLLQQADVMLCDTSSILFMFILQNKPVVTFNNADPGAHLIDFSVASELEQHLSQALTRPAQLMRDIEAFNQQLHPDTDGRSSERVLAAVENALKKINPPKRKKPLNLVRNLKARRELNYWKP